MENSIINTVLSVEMCDKLEEVRMVFFGILITRITTTDAIIM